MLSIRFNYLGSTGTVRQRYAIRDPGSYSTSDSGAAGYHRTLQISKKSRATCQAEDLRGATVVLLALIADELAHANCGISARPSKTRINLSVQIHCHTISDRDTPRGIRYLLELNGRYDYVQRIRDVKYSNRNQSLERARSTGINHWCAGRRRQLCVLVYNLKPRGVFR